VLLLFLGILFLLFSTWCYIMLFYAFISIFNGEYICSYLSHLAQRILDRSHSASKSAKVLLLKVAVPLYFMFYYVEINVHTFLK
jgi:hypothetical protein